MSLHCIRHFFPPVTIYIFQEKETCVKCYVLANQVTNGRIGRHVLACRRMHTFWKTIMSGCYLLQDKGEKFNSLYCDVVLLVEGHRDNAVLCVS